MTSISSIETITPRTLSSLPPTPKTSSSQDERAWLNDEPDNRKNKGKERQLGLQYDSSGGDQPRHSNEGLEYPPINDDAAETRRVEENLRKWELTERQRRKQARESLQAPPSLMGDVSRLLRSGRTSRHATNTTFGTHVALQSHENVCAVPMQDINASPTPSPIPSPPRRDSVDPENPFTHNVESLSPFDDSHQQESLMNPSTDSSPSVPPSSMSSYELTRPASLSISTSFSRVPPTPKPLGLPPPRTPPPPIDAPPSPTSPLTTKGPRGSTQDTNKETRWWHDWLCGCSEGPDRGGDYQAGRTNPFE